MRHIASLSGGKDSVAMVLNLIERGYPLDEVVFFDNGMEFQAVYKTIEELKDILSQNDIKFTVLRPDYDFEWKMFEKPVNGRNGFHYGYSWCGGRCRWGTTDKLRCLRDYCKGAIQYVGIASDEEKRFEKAKHENKVLPLVEWGMTEADCLQYCYDRGFFWEENGIRLYDILDRVSCWCCANKNLKELRNMHEHLPEYWERLKGLQARTERPMKGEGKSVFDLEERFTRERIQKENGVV